MANNNDNIISIEKHYNCLSKLNQAFVSNNVIILHVNVRSLNANHQNLEILINSLHTKPDVIVCTETWKLEYYKYYKLADYTIYYSHGNINKADGVVIYVKSTISHTTTNENIGPCNILSIMLRLKNSMSFKITGIYRCHDINVDNFNVKMKEYLILNKNVKHHCIVGDFNINLLKVDFIAEQFLETMLGSGYVNCFSDITRPNSLEGSCIDNMFIKSKIARTNSFTYTNAFTDHYPIFLTINLQKENNAKAPKAVINYNKLKILVDKTDFNYIFDIQDPNTAIDALINEIQTLKRESTLKIKSNKYRNKCKFSVPRKNWITEGIVKSCNTKEMLYNLWKLDKNNAKLKDDYKTYCKILNSVVTRAKRNYDAEQVSESSSDSKKLWQYINNKLGKNNKVDNDIKYLIYKNKEITDDKEVADVFVDFFSSIGLNLARKINLDKKSEGRASELVENNCKSIFIRPTDSGEIFKTIKNLKDKAGGLDEINSKVLKTIAHSISKPLEHIFNISIIKGIWPRALKSAVVVPIYKNGEYCEPSNYRPISLISNLAKVFEKLIHHRLSDFITECNIISERQFGFLKNRSTSDAHADLVQYIYDNLNSDKRTIITFLDLAKAFDTVNHVILLNKLERYGIRGVANNLIKDYLNNRVQTVKYKGFYSKFENVKIGVPQGTILGPLLFLIYINDIFSVVDKKYLLSYADDTAVRCSGDKWDEVQKDMNNMLKIVSNWLINNQLTLNVDKTVYLTFSCYSDSIPKTVIRINNKIIKAVNSCKYLGIYIDSCLKWNVHIQELVKKVRYFQFLVYKLSYFMEKNVLKMLYHTLFESTINYGIIAWGGAYKSSIKPLFSLQKRILKKIRVDDKIILNIKQHFVLSSLTKYFKFCMQKYNNYEGRSRHKLIQGPKITKTKFSSSPLYTAIKYFNLLPNEIKNLPILTKSIKYKLKKWLIGNLEHLLTL